MSRIEGWHFPPSAYHWTKHALEQVLAKGFEPDAIRDAICRPDEVYMSKSHPGQYRLTGNGICLVITTSGFPMEPTVVTVYENRTLTPLRPDQIARGEKINRVR